MSHPGLNLLVLYWNVNIKHTNIVQKQLNIIRLLTERYLYQNLRLSRMKSMVDHNYMNEYLDLGEQTVKLK